MSEAGQVAITERKESYRENFDRIFKQGKDKPNEHSEETEDRRARR